MTTKTTASLGTGEYGGSLIPSAVVETLTSIYKTSFPSWGTTTGTSSGTFTTAYPVGSGGTVSTGTFTGYFSAHVPPTLSDEENDIVQEAIVEQLMMPVKKRKSGTKTPYVVWGGSGLSIGSTFSSPSTVTYTPFDDDDSTGSTWSTTWSTTSGE